MAKNIREQGKTTLSEIKKNPQRTNSEGERTGSQINNLEHKEEISIQPEQNEKTRIQKKNKVSIRCLWNICKSTNI